MRRVTPPISANIEIRCGALDGGTRVSYGSGPTLEREAESQPAPNPLGGAAFGSPPNVLALPAPAPPVVEPGFAGGTPGPPEAVGPAAPLPERFAGTLISMGAS